MDLDERSASLPVRLGQGPTPGIVLGVISDLDDDDGSGGDLLRKLRVVEEVLVEFPDEGRVPLLKGFGHGSAVKRKPIP